MSVPEKDQHPFSRQFMTGHILADEGELEGALDSFRDVPRSAHEWEASLFNQAILLARLGYLSDAEALFRELADRGIATNKLIAALSCTKNQGPRTPVCLDIPLKLREEALAEHKETIRQEEQSQLSAQERNAGPTWDDGDFDILARKMWDLCHSKFVRRAARKLIRILSNESLSNETRIRLKALSNQLGSVGFQAAAIANDRIFSRSALVSQLNERAKAEVKWIPSMEDDIISFQSSMEDMCEVKRRPIIQYLRKTLQTCSAQKILVTGPLASWLFDSPSYTIKREIESDYEVLRYPTQDPHNCLAAMGAIRQIVTRDPNRKEIFISLFHFCPWFPLQGPPCTSTSLFPKLKTPYTARVICWGMIRWDGVLKYLALNTEGTKDVEYEWFVTINMDPMSHTDWIEAMKASQSNSERARLLFEYSQEMLEFERRRRFSPDIKYVGSFEEMIERVNKTVALAVLP